MKAKQLEFSLHLPSRPLLLEVDPEFDLFRRLHRDELPSSLGQLFAAQDVLFVLPSSAADELRDGYRKLAISWAGDSKNLVWDHSIEQLPVDRSVWLLGWENRFRPLGGVSRPESELRFDHESTSIMGERLKRGKHSVVVVSRSPDSLEQKIGWIGCDNPKAMIGLGYKLPHYSKYSYLAFSGDAPTNILKGQWPVHNSPLKRTLAPEGNSVTSVLPPRPPLAYMDVGT
ncbi:MAG: hypothetical protein GY731_04590 [Gammaproteobacteria bacterium]|nr:hypothetical protein [Gammaproteobacteria bacterium]